MMMSHDQRIIHMYKQVSSGKRKRFPRGFWKSRDVSYKCRLLIKYYIEQELGWDKDTLEEEFKTQTLLNSYLSGMLFAVYHGKAYDAIKDVYPDINIKRIS